MKSKQVQERRKLLERRKRRVRKKISGTAERPRLSVFRSTRHVYAQVIDDTTGRTLVSASSYDNKEQNANAEICKTIGLLIGERCKEKNIAKVVFDKNGRLYAGRVKAVAEGARSAGLEF